MLFCREAIRLAALLTDHPFALTPAEHVLAADPFYAVPRLVCAHRLPVESVDSWMPTPGPSGKLHSVVIASSNAQV